MKGYFYKHDAKLKTNKNYKKAHTDRFNTYNLRLGKVKEVVIDILKDLYVKVDDACKVFFAVDDYLNQTSAEGIRELVGNYIENLKYDDTIDLQTIIDSNKCLDQDMEGLAKGMLNYNSELAGELGFGIKGRIIESGYKFLFNVKKMDRYKEENRILQARKLSDRQINEGKAISAMFSNLYSSDVAVEMLKAIKPIQQEG